MKKAIFIAMLILSLSSCIEEGDYNCVIVPEDQEPRTAFSLRFDTGMDVETKSILGDSADSRQSGGVVAVYNAKTGRLDSEWPVSDFSKSLSMKLPSSATLDFYVMANMWIIASDGSKKAVTFPKKESDVAKMAYRMDGGKVTGGRTEKFSEASTYGIPAAGSLKGVKVSSTPSLSIQLKRLFAKVTITVDHSGLDGGKSVSYFKNSDLYLRQTNVLLSPFASASKALASADVVTKSDYDAAMTNGHSLTYTFYAPENRLSAFPTYVEFTGTVNTAAGGYGGKVSYRFYIGSESGSDYDIEGNRNYKVHLGFKVNSLFVEPEWQVSLGDDWSDKRGYGLAADSAGSKRLSSGNTIAVRKGRAATCWLYWNRKGSGTNEAATLLEACNGTYNPSDLTKAAWWCEAPGLSAAGISLTSSGAKLTFKVSDNTKFKTGQSIPVKIHFYPGDLVWEGVVKTYDDISVSVSDDIETDYYVGMKRSVKVKGLAGSKVYYWNSYGVDCLALKASTVAGADWIHNAKSSSQMFSSSGSLDLCAYANTHGDQFMLKLVSNDTFNDGDVITTMKVRARELRLDVKSTSVQLPFDGTPVDVPYCYYDEAGKEIAKTRFDSAIYSQILCPSAVWPSIATVPISKWVGYDGMKIFLKAYNAGTSSIVETVKPTSGLLGPVNFETASNDISHGSASVMVYVKPPYWGTPFPSVYSDYFNVQGASDIVAKADLVLPDKISYSVEKSGILSSEAALNVTAGTSGHNSVEWKFSDTSRTPDGQAPVGQQTVSFVFSNKNSGEKYRLSSTFNVTHNVTLRPFVLFTSGATSAKVYATTAKNAWMMKRNCAGENVPLTADFLGLGSATYKQYVTMKYDKATKKGKTENTIFRGSDLMAQYQYQDYDPSTYGKGYTWTAARIQTFVSSGRNPLTYLGFCGPATSYTPLSTPLAASYVAGNSYILLSASNSLLGSATK